jgi:hypothetical protein
MRAPTLLVATLIAGSAAGLAVACPSPADAQSITVEKASCNPMEENGIIRGTVGSTAAGLSPRLYFRWKDHEDFYWVNFEPEMGNRFWAVPPKPEQRNKEIEYYAALVDPAGKVAARSETQVVPVTKDCRVPLDLRQRGVAQNLTVGETSPQQQGKKVRLPLRRRRDPRQLRGRAPLRRGLPRLRDHLLRPQGGADPRHRRGRRSHHHRPRTGTVPVAPSPLAAAARRRLRLLSPFGP